MRSRFRLSKTVGDVGWLQRFCHGEAELDRGIDEDPTKMVVHSTTPPA